MVVQVLGIGTLLRQGLFDGNVKSESKIVAAAVVQSSNGAVDRVRVVSADLVLETWSVKLI